MDGTVRGRQGASQAVEGERVGGRVERERVGHRVGRKRVERSRTVNMAQRSTHGTHAGLGLQRAESESTKLAGHQVVDARAGVKHIFNRLRYLAFWKYSHCVGQASGESLAGGSERKTSDERTGV